jgi:hypothetical protein
MTGNQMLHPLNLRNAAGALDRPRILPKEALASTGLHERSSFSLPDCNIRSDRNLEASLPFLDIPFGCRRITFDPADILTDIGHGYRLPAD